jgi:LmbE family N-acetylglucosaminyl deacetylase
MVGCDLRGVQRVLCLGAHSDDIEIGCGGTVLELLRRQPGLEFYWVVFSADARRTREARRSARAFLRGAKVKAIRTGTFRESYFPQDWPGIKDWFEKIKQEFAPDLVFTHCREDRHQDHRVLSDLAWNTFRNHLILEYEIPKYDGDLGNPNLYLRLDEEITQRKVEYLCAFFQTQGNKHWFSADTFLALLRLRGIECASPTKYAEAFHCRKLVL